MSARLAMLAQNLPSADFLTTAVVFANTQQIELVMQKGVFPNITLLGMLAELAIPHNGHPNPLWHLRELQGLGLGVILATRQCIMGSICTPGIWQRIGGL
ncbi:hypothetical protein PR048_031095 [Dryococelus australis]|uniref:Uncharacterized protein n=1 Tax=Dryococelus australis TaxID=614101 RepID=A0ABQ9G4A0_9NEOP|nr:hypothetical protein PR048_031095 [Dryococelus australis]